MTEEEHIMEVIAQADKVLARKPDVVEVIEYKLAGTGAAPLPVTSMLEKSIKVAGETNLVKVQYYSMTTGELSPRPYTYYSTDRLAVGDIVTVPVRDTTGKAKVSAIDVPASEIAAFRDKVKTIPSGSVADTKINLCDTCTLRNDYPICYSPDIAFGDGIGNDNIIQCSKHINGPAAPCSIPVNVVLAPEPVVGSLAAAAEAAGAEVTRVTMRCKLDDGHGGEVDWPPVEKEVKVMTITERINAVVDARETARKATEERILAYNDWVLGDGGRLLSKEKIAKEECQEAEEALREEALRVYVKTSNKKVAPGVGIRVNTRLDYDPERALGWAVGHNLALKLDAKAFEALARINPIPFVTITEEPQATLSATLEKVGE